MKRDSTPNAPPSLDSLIDEVASAAICLLGQNAQAAQAMQEVSRAIGITIDTLCQLPPAIPERLCWQNTFEEAQDTFEISTELSVSHSFGCRIFETRLQRSQPILMDTPQPQLQSLSQWSACEDASQNTEALQDTAADFSDTLSQQIARGEIKADREDVSIEEVLAQIDEALSE